jgi:threonine synthase
MSIWRFADRLPKVPIEARVDLGTGDTPLVRSHSIGKRVGLENLFFKLEATNPSGSYKDRFAAVAVSLMKAEGKTRALGTSSGNAGAAMAAHCAAAGMACETAVLETAPDGKLNQMRAYGAKIFRVRGFGIDPRVTQGVLDYLQEQGAQPGSALQITAYCFCPQAMQGVKTIGYELVEQCGAPIDHVFAPIGSGGLGIALCEAFEELKAEGAIQALPRVECVQPEGNNTVAGPLRAGALQGTEVKCTTQVSGLQVPNLLDGNTLIEAARRCGGTGHVVSDQEIWSAQARLIREEGIYCEPAAAAALAGALAAHRRGELDPGTQIVCLVTGAGFKDEGSIQRMLAGQPCPTLDLSDLGRI